MFNYNFYIANGQVKPDLPAFDMNEIPPLPAFEVQSGMPIQEAQPFYTNPVFLVCVFVFIGIIFCFIISTIISARRQAKIEAYNAHKAKLAKKKSRTFERVMPEDYASSTRESVKVKPKVEKPDVKNELKNAFKLKKEQENVQTDSELDKNIQEQEKVETLDVEVSSDEEVLAGLKLGTPKSVQNCIKNFLEITIAS